MQKKKICYLGKELHTSHWINLPSGDCNSIRKAYYAKPNKKDVQISLKKIGNGSSNISIIVKYYFKNLMSKVRLQSARWTIDEVMQCDDLIRYYYSRIMSSEKIYPPSKGIQKNFETALRISGGNVAMKPSNFPIKVSDYILEKYNTNDNYYDFSCGWGVRLLSSMRKGLNYYGTDPNHLLVYRLKSLYTDYNTENKTIYNPDIRCQGSEIYIPEWENKMGLIFSSPPYYCLEDYGVGCQSIYKDGENNIKTYDEWLVTYINPTIEHCVKYLVHGGYFLVNVKNSKEHCIYDDIFKELKKYLNYIGTEDLTIIKRPSSKKNLNTNEHIMVFQKKNSNRLD